MVDVNWDGTEKVIDQSCHTVTLTNDVMQKLCRLRTTISTVQNKNRMLNFKNIQHFISKYQLNHQYLLETSYNKMIPTISSIH